MLDLFRRLSKSKLGALVFALFIAALALGFVAADVQNLGIGGSAASGDTVAKIGSEELSIAQVQDRVQRAFENARQQQPELTIQQFVREGGVEQVLRQMTDSMAVARFAQEQGFGVSRKMEDAQIASAGAFRGLNGQFDQAAYESFLQQQRISEKQLRGDLARDLYLNQVLLPATGAAFAPATLTLPYASMLLEQRTGRAQFIPAAAFRGAAPSDAELNGFYRANLARYTVPERRVVRYALINRTAFEAAAQPTEQEIAKAYDAGKAQYAGRETRTISEIIILDEQAARQAAARVQGGAAIADVARDLGLESRTLNDQSREAYASASAPAVAAAVFQTAQGQVAPLTRSGLGWHLAKVDRVANTAGRTLDQARPEIADRLRREKAEQAFEEARLKIEESITDGATFDEVVAANKLQPVVTPPLLADGRNPEGPASPAAPELATILNAAFAADINDDPTVEAIGQGESYAVVKADRTIPPSPRPLAQIRDQVVADLYAQRGLAGARRAADAIAGRVNGGTALAQAITGAGVALPPAATLSGRRGELLQRNRPDSPQLDALFTLARGKARVAPAPDRSGWFVVTLESTTPGDARTQPQLIAATRSQFAPVLGQEYGQQLAAAARAAVGVDVNAAAVARLKSELLGNAAAQ